MGQNLGVKDTKSPKNIFQQGRRMTMLTARTMGKISYACWFYLMSP